VTSVLLTSLHTVCVDPTEALMKVRIPLVFISCVLIYGQVAVAQAISQGVLLNQQSMQNAGNAGAQTTRIAQPARTQSGGAEARPAVYDPNATPHSFDTPGRSKQPFLSEYAGYVTPGTQLTISSPVSSATIYYTTDGWTPTEDSLRFVRPLTIQNDMRVQAFAVEPGMLPSPIVDATYIVKPRQAPPTKTLLIEDGILHRGMALRLVTGTDARSDSSQLGDNFLVKLDQNLMAGETIVAARGSLGKAILTRVERAGRDGKPGVIAFRVESLDVHGISVPLTAKLTLAAPDAAAQAAKIANPNVVHISGTLPRGEEAVIEPGMPLTAIVGADTPLR
jgi:hypothetical protein